MVDAKTIQEQLKKLKFGTSIWNQAELRELPKIIHEGEEISECVNGIYEGGMALLVATEMRVLLIDKKPLNFLTVEDLRFDMINEIDYSHRLMGATITISTGGKTLRFSSLNQPRLRRLIGLVQEHMSNGKKQQAEKAATQQQHLEEINKQLQMYLLAQHQHLQQQMIAQNVEPLKPSPGLSDYLFAQRLLEKFQKDNSGAAAPTAKRSIEESASSEAEQETERSQTPVLQADVVQDARREVFGASPKQPSTPRHATASATKKQALPTVFKGIEINPLRVAYSRLPMMLRNRKFGRASHEPAAERPVMQSRRTAQPTSS